LTAEILNRLPVSGLQPWDTSSSHRPRVSQTWDEYWRDVGVGEEDLGIGQDCIIDPDGSGPRIWFQAVPEGNKAVPKTKNKLHLDLRVGEDDVDAVVASLKERRAAFLWNGARDHARGSPWPIPRAMSSACPRDIAAIITPSRLPACCCSAEHAA
jgi:glyoxalase superfamily protein